MGNENIEFNSCINPSKGVRKDFVATKNDDTKIAESSPNSVWRDNNVKTDKEINLFEKNEGASGMAHESVERDRNKNGQITKEYLKKYNRNDFLLSKTSVEYKYDKNGQEIAETGAIYDENNKPQKSYTSNFELNEQGQTIKASTTKYDKKGQIVSSELDKAEYIEQGNISRSTQVEYDKNGKIFTKIIDDTYHNDKGEKTKNTWQYYEKDQLKHELIFEFGPDGSEIKTTKQKYDSGLLSEKIVEENNVPAITTTEQYGAGKMTSKKVATLLYDDYGNITNEKIENQDEKGNVLNKSNIIRQFDDNHKETGSSLEKYDKENKLLGKTINSIQGDSKGKRTSASSETYDAKCNLTSKVLTQYKTHGEQTFLSSQTKTNYQEGKIVSVETLEKSELKGELQYKITDASGKVTNLVEVQKNENGANITKKLESPDGTKTDYQYNEDKDGNTKLMYKISDKDNKELMSTSREYKKVNEKLAISKVDGKEYRIEKNENKIKVFDVTNKKYTSIDLNALVKGDNGNLKKIIASQPGDLLLGLKKEINRITPDIDNGDYSDGSEALSLDGYSSTVAHEYGHAADSTPNAINKNVSLISEDKEFLKTFNKELESFKDTASEADVEAFSYLEKTNEFIAEAKMVTTTRGDKDWNSMRELMLMKYFPNSIAVVSQKLKEIESGNRQKKVD